MKHSEGGIDYRKVMVGWWRLAGSHPSQSATPKPGRQSPIRPLRRAAKRSSGWLAMY